MATPRMCRQTFQSVWKALPHMVRLDVAQAFWESKDGTEDLHEQAIADLSATLHMRTVKLRHLTTPKLAGYLAAQHKPSESVAGAALRSYLFKHKREMMAAFLDSLSIQHENCRFDRHKYSPPSSRELANALAGLRGAFPASDVDLYIDVLFVQDPGFWKGLEQIDPAGDGSESRETIASVQAVASEPPALKISRPEGLEDFTVVDDLITTAIVGWATGVQGALEIGQVESMVTELISLNAQRHRSYFHPGFLDVLQDKEPQPHFRGENPSRRAWYLCGAIVAYARRGNTSSIVALFEKEDLRSFGRELNPCSRRAAQFLFESLCEQGRAGAAATFFTPQMIAYADLFDTALEWGTKQLRMGKVDDAAAILDLLHRSLAHFTEDQISRDRFQRLQRRRAHCLRLKHDFQPATQILEDLLKAPDLEAESIIRTDLAMIKAGFRGLFDIAMPPQEQQLQDFCGRMQILRKECELALGARGEKAHAQYCLGMLALAESIITSISPQVAASLLEPAVSYMRARGETYVVGDLLKGADFYLALALVQTLDDTRQDYAVELFANSILSGYSPPGYLLRRFLESLAAVDPDRTQRAAELALSQLQLRGATLESLMTAEVARRSTVIWTSLFNWAISDSHSRTKRFRYLRILLEEAIAAQHTDLAEQALDALENLACQGVCIDEFVGLMRDSTAYDPAWSQAEASWASVHVLERSGSYEQAAQFLREEFHRRLWSGDFSARDEATDIVERISAYSLQDNAVEDLKRTLRGWEEAHFQQTLLPETSRSTTRLCITVIGGDETQARFDAAIQERLAESMPGLELHFEHTKWSSNWGDQFESMKPLLQRSDAVVVMRLIRTNLGKKLRSFCPLWVGCSGRGASSIERAICLAGTLSDTRRSSQR